MSIHSIGQETIQYDPNIAENSQTVFEVQEALSRLGFSVPQNGEFNSQTEQALRQFQQQHHLNNRGTIDQPTIDALNRDVQRQESSSSQTTGGGSSQLAPSDRNRRTQELQWEGRAREGELRGRPLGEEHATMAPSAREQALEGLQASLPSPAQVQLQQSITQAAHLLEPSSRGTVEEGWQDRLRGATVQMRSVADAFQRDGGAASYRNLSQYQREQVWRNLLMSDQVSTAQDILRSLRLQNTEVAQGAVRDLENAERSLRDIPRAQANAPVHTAADIVQGLNQQTRREQAVAVENAASLAGDPRPARPNRQDVELYTRLTQRAYTRADLASYTDEARRPALHAFMTFMGAFPDSSTGDAARTAAESAITERHPHMEGPFFALTVMENLSAAEQTYNNFATPEGRFRHALQQAALDEAGGNEGRARQILQRLSQTGQQLQTDLRWLQRHPDHPGFPPAQDTFE